MKQRKIMLPTIAEAKAFVAVAMKCDFDINVFYNRVIIDAKSILGVLSLDLRRVLTVEYDGENEDLEAFLNEKAASKYNAA
ncbi:HPr family phosphocarrier protein [Clostridium sp. AM58-1XD]|uniref:HPr family phosphocarrier protein n=1 Tax=Clostridium sp. AM58-1XD TaxID=2292307 RepID=UPI000E4CDD2E|nr:HPr family phosphocarrier protein [Clostridium sp. AM58-1XD]RGY96955.1 HPr family phosphocarrier protein [Clostridium sp. AM58-1XD]